MNKVVVYGTAIIAALYLVGRHNSKVGIHLVGGGPRNTSVSPRVENRQPTIAVTGEPQVINI